MGVLQLGWRIQLAHSLNPVRLATEVISAQGGQPNNRRSWGREFELCLTPRGSTGELLAQAGNPACRRRMPDGYMQDPSGKGRGRHRADA
jgi:hypothetical protein